MIRTLFSYYLRDYIRSYRYTIPLLFYITCIGGTYYNKPNPVMGSYSFTCLFIFVFSAWLAFGFVDLEDTTQQQITILHTKRQNTYYLCKVLFMWIFVTMLGLLTVIYPVLKNVFNRPVNVQDIVWASIGHSLVGFLGITVAFLFNSRIVRDRKFALIGVVFVIVISIIKGPLSTMNVIFNWIVIVLPPIYDAVETMGGLDKMDVINYYSMAPIFIFTLIYSTILTLVFIKFMKKKKF